MEGDQITALKNYRSDCGASTDGCTPSGESQASPNVYDAVNGVFCLNINIYMGQNWVSHELECLRGRADQEEVEGHWIRPINYRLRIFRASGWRPSV